MERSTDTLPKGGFGLWWRRAVHTARPARLPCVPRRAGRLFLSLPVSRGSLSGYSGEGDYPSPRPARHTSPQSSPQRVGRPVRGERDGVTGRLSGKK